MSKTIEETYKKLSQREHVLQRPGMYIGNVKKVIEEQWVFDDAQKKMIKKFIEFSPGFLKIFDEILSNATDHAARDASVNAIKVDFDTNTGEITVWNNGEGIPVVLHKDHNIYVPELIFGHLLSGSNYNDSDKRTGIGVNGLGSKCSNIFSKKFCVETTDSKEGKRFYQEYSNNMTSKSKPKITNNSSKSYTKITFLPDYERFGMKGLESDTVMLLNKRVYDCIACTNKSVSIYLNGEKLKGKGLTDYIKYFFDSGSDESVPKIFYDSVQSGNLLWEWAILPWEKFEHVSFVNGTSTYAGGKHVDHIVYQVTSKLKGMLETKKKLKDVKPSAIKDRMFLFLCATVVNPHFNSQTKECLTTQSKDFGIKVEVGEKFINNLWKSEIIQDIVEFSKLKESMDLAKSTSGTKKSKIFVPKLEDALWAGTARSDQCTLILTEGDSAKTFAMWGRSVVGNDKLGVYPLRGKVLNVRDASNTQLLNNEELNNLKTIIGLKHGKDYKNVSELRYGKVMLLTDADVDGSHISCLVINFFHFFWPNLLKLNFLQTLKTPIVKAIKGKNVIEFFTEGDYNKWKESTNTNGYNIRYFKGLGTSKRDDAKETFTRFSELLVDYYHKDSKCDESILLAFDKDKNANKKTDTVKCSDLRKKWLSSYDKNIYIGREERRTSFQDLIHKELIHFSIYDNLRSIPNMCDGLKPSQRKILFYTLSKNINKEIKVAQLSGYVSAETSYHHGESSLQGAIIGMAQDFIGTNNINLLSPDSNFGSRWACGKDAASPRYIFTKLSPITPLIFHPHDTPLLNFLNDDGVKIEPEWYVPVIPMILINGCEGIGTGFSTFIPPYNPQDIINNIKRVMNDQQPLPLIPYFKGFNGQVVDLGGGTWSTCGRWERVSDTQIKITEIPVGTGVTPYKEFLESHVENAKGKAAENKNKSFVLKDVKNSTTDENTGINFLIEFKSKQDLDKLISTDSLDKDLRLSKSFNINNMYCFDDNCIPVKYADPNDILLDFYDIRLEFYTKRKDYLIQKYSYDLSILTNKIRFINEYISGQLNINRKNKEQVVGILTDKKFDSIEGTFDYLTNMPIITLTEERIADLEKKETNLRGTLDKLKRSSETDLWKEDLDAIEALLPKN